MSRHLNRRQFVQAGAVTAGALLTQRRGWSQGTSLDIVRDGKSDYSIVVPAQASPSQTYAAQELQRLIREMSGAELPIVADDAALPAKAILLGVTRHTAGVLGAQPDLAALGDDGFHLRTVGPHLAIVGSPVRGTLYGVYELLERYGGYRWYSSFYTVVPQRTSWSVPPLDDTQTPAFVMREPFWWDMFNGDHAARCRANGNRMQLEEKHGGKIRFGGGLFVHTFYNLMPPAEFFADHPEYFSEINGQRTADHAQLCLTNPDVLRIVTERLRQRIRQDPGAKLYSVSQNDWGGWCTCANCRAIDEAEGSQAGTVIQFVNQVAEAVEQEFPNVWIETLAYHYTRHAPKTVRPRSNVVPRLCSIECDFSLPLDVSPYEQNVRFVQDIQDWSAMTDKLYVWDYTTNFAHYLGPHPNFGALQGNVKFFRDHSVVGLFEQGAYQSPHAEFAELRAWLLAKLLWNPDQDTAPLLDDFFAGYYGPAAEPIRTYFDELQALVKPPDQVLRIGSPMTAPWYSDEFFDRAAGLFAAAEERVKDDPDALHRVKMTGMSVIYAKLARWPAMDVGFTLRDGTMRPDGVDPTYSALAAELLGRIEAGKVTHIAESRERHNAFVSLLRGRTVGYELATLEAGGVKVGAVAELGGRLVSLTLGDGPNQLHADAGGVQIREAGGALGGDDGRTYAVSRPNEGGLQLTCDVRYRWTVRRTVTATDGQVKVVNAVTSQKTAADTVSPQVLVALDLGDADTLCLRGTGDWRPVPVAADQMMASTSLHAAELGDALQVASAATGRGMNVKVSGGQVQRALLIADAARGAGRLLVSLARSELAGRATAETTVELEPLAKVEGLPQLTPAGRHEARRVVIDECFINLGRPGEWGDFVPDDDAEDGWAAKLYNTHYEWCLQWPVDAALVRPGAKYHLRARIRVDAAAAQGEAFGAGVYDTVRKTGYGGIRLQVDKVGDGYRWYDIATWVPEAGQYVWFAPGQFDLKGGAKSAVNAVYVDRFELALVDE